MATVPVAVYLRSGDITVLSGDSRLACHAVPRILPQHCDTFVASCFDPPDQPDSTQQAGSFPDDIYPPDQVDSTQQAGSFPDDIDPPDQVDSTQQAGSWPDDIDPPDQPDSTQQAGSCPGDSDHQRNAVREVYNSFVCNSSSDDRTRDTQSLRSGQDFSDILPSDVASQDSCDQHLLKETANRTNADVIQMLQDLTWDPLGVYIAVNRINMNVRQVLKCGQTFPPVAD